MVRKIKDATKGAKQALLTSTLFVIPLAMPAQLSYAEGLSAQFTLGQSLQQIERSGNDSTQDEGTFSRTDLGIRLTSETRTQKLEFSANTGLAYKLSSGGTQDRFDIEDPTALLTYSVENRSTLLDFSASYRRSDIDETAFLDDDGEIETGAGQRETFGLVTNLTLGREARTRLDLTHTLREVQYSGTADPSLVDISTQGIEGRLTFQISPVAEVSVFTDYLDVDAAGAGSSDRTDRRTGVGARYDINPSLTATAELSYSNITSDNNAGTVTNRSGLGYRLGLAKDLPNGSLNFSLDEEETVNGKRRDVSIGRDYAFKRGTFAFSLGVTKTDGLSARPIANISANLELGKTSTLGITLSQSSAVNDDNETTINSRLGLTYARELTALSSLLASVQVSDRNVLSPGGQDQTSVQLNLSHRYQVGNDWELVSGVTYSKTRRDVVADSSNSTVSIGLEKTFDWRP